MTRISETLHPKTGETAADFHCREFSEFYEANQRGEFGDNKEDWEDKDDYAFALWQTLEEARAYEPNPFALVSYSAGVYCGEVYSNDADAYFVLPGLENLPLVPKNLDLWDFHDRFDNPDLHADGAEECLFAFGDAISTDTLENPLEHTEEAEAALLAFMRVACPAYTAVLRAWNQHLDDASFWKFWGESHCDTFFENLHSYVN